eukprot:551468_1
MSLLNKIDNAVCLLDLASMISTNAFNEDITDILSNYEIQKNGNVYPYSIKMFIKWVYCIEKKKKVIELDFNKIENDMKYQYLLYHQTDPEYLQSMYYNYNLDKFDYMAYKKTEELNLENKKLFGTEDNHTIIHYILYELSLHEGFIFNKINTHQDILKITEQGLMIIKLLIKNKIITTEETYEAGTCGISIYEQIKLQLLQMDHYISDDNKYKQIYIDIYFEFVLYCMQWRHKLNNYNMEPIMMVEIPHNDIWKTHNFFQTEAGSGGYYKYHFKSFISNKTKLIQRLIFRGIEPFAVCIEQQMIYDYHFHTNISFCKLFEKQLSFNNSFDIQLFRNKMASCSPLMIFPFLRQAK